MGFEADESARPTSWRNVEDQSLRAALCPVLVVGLPCGRCVHQEEALPDHGRHPLPWQQSYRAKTGVHPPGRGHNRLAPPSVDHRPPRFRLPPRASLRLRGRLLLARLPLALPHASGKPPILATQDRQQQRPRSPHHPAASQSRLASSPHLGPCAHIPSNRCRPHHFSVEHRRQNVQNTAKQR